MRKGKSSPNTTSEATAPGGSHRPRGKVGQLLKKLKEGAKKLRISHCSPEGTCFIEREYPVSLISGVRTAPSVVAVEAGSRSPLQDAQEAAANRMHSLSGLAMAVDSVLQDAQEDLDDADSFQDTYLEPLRMFDTVIGKLADVHPYTKMALGAISCAAKLKQIATTRYSNSGRYVTFTVS
ncbi:hypothetical protein BDR07DRAFT_1371699 [Suillus spraguei]|nr:hypothetical protein BDR07DRAFT_1371699 [Suillus spraguei]